MSSFLSIFLLVLWCALLTHCADIHPYFKGLQMGIGSDYEVGKTYGMALQNTSTKVEDFAGRETDWKFTQITTSQQLLQALGMTNSWSIKSLFHPSASSSMSLVHSSDVNRYSAHLLVKASIKNPARNIPRPTISEEAKNILSKFGLLGFEQYFGVEYLGGVISGGLYLGMITVYTQNEQEKQKVLAGIKFSGYGLSVKLDVSYSAQTVMNNRRVEIYGVQVGGGAQSFARTLPDMIQQLKDFPAQVLEYPAPIEGIFHKYQDTIPFDWQGDATDYTVRDRLLQALGARILTLKDRKNDLQYVQKNYNSFEVLMAQNLSQKDQDLIQISKEISEINAETKNLNKCGENCVSNLVQCIEPTANYTPVFTLPKQGFVDELSKNLGMATMFFGNYEDVPFGWQLCDGSNGTPDLRGRFPIGYSHTEYGSGSIVQTTSIGQKGGFATKQLSINEMPQHRHTINSGGAHTHGATYAGAHQHNLDDHYNSGKGLCQYGKELPNQNVNYIGFGSRNNDMRFCVYEHKTSWSGSHTHSIGRNGNHNHTENYQGSSQAFDILPPRTSIYFICKTN